MNLKSHLIFTLYTIYGILLKGESACTSGARACGVYVWGGGRARALLQANTRAGYRGAGARARSHAGPG